MNCHMAFVAVTAHPGVPWSTSFLSSPKKHHLEKYAHVSALLPALSSRTELLGPGRLPLLHFPGSNASFPASALEAILLQFLLRAFRSSRNFGMKPTGVISGVQHLKQCPNPTIQISCHPKRTWSDNVGDLHEGKNCSVTRTPVPWYRPNLR